VYIASNASWIELAMTTGGLMADKQSETRDYYLGVGIALGIAIGAGLGVALGNLAIGIGLGVACGAGLGAILGGKRRDDAQGSSEDDRNHDA
jgi:hypothetical protein